MVPGVHYKDFKVWGDIMPVESEVQALCARCLPQGRPAAPLEPPDVISGSSSSSGEESSSVGVGAAKRPRLGGTGPVDAGPGAA